MGYDMRQVGASFFMPREQHAAALASLKELAQVDDLGYSNPRLVRNARDLFAALEECCWNLKFDEEEGNAIGIQFTGESASHDLEVFQAIAPYVREGSYIEMTGAEGAHWRWVFKDGECEEIEGKVTFS